MQKRFILSGLFLAVVLSNFVSAAIWWGQSPVELISESIGFRFVLFWALFGVMIFYALSKSRLGGDSSKGVALAISAIASLLIVIVMLQRGWLYTDQIGGIVMLFAALIFVAFLLGIGYGLMGPYGVFIMTLVAWIVLYNIDFYSIFSGSTFDFVGSSYEWLMEGSYEGIFKTRGTWVFFCIAVVLFIISWWAHKRVRRRTP